jgi:hypothetical protein
MKTIIAKHRSDWKSQGNNTKPYWIDKGNVVGEGGKILFPIEDFDKRESELYDRVTHCFISSGSMFCGALYKAGILSTPVDEVAYYQLVNENLKGKENRFYWSAHERVLDMLMRPDYDLRVMDAKTALPIIRQNIDSGFPSLMSIWIKPWYPSGRGHIVIVSGYMLENDGTVYGYFLDDPFGNVLTKYRDKNGDKVFISAKEMEKLLDSPKDQPRKAGILARKK